MLAPYEVTSGVHVLPSAFAVGPLGLVPVNAFLVTGEAPYLVDTGAAVDRGAFVDALESIIDPGELRLIYLTHVDPDHTGALDELLVRAPRAKVVTTFVSTAKLELMGRSVLSDRLHLLNPGETLVIGQRRLTAAKPPLFDAAETTALYDATLDALFSSDSFGAPLSRVYELANDVPSEELRSAQTLWATVDAPWIHNIDRARFGNVLRRIVGAGPEWVFSSHLPPAWRMVGILCENLSRAPDSPPFVAPNQRDIETARMAAEAAAHERI